MVSYIKSLFSSKYINNFETYNNVLEVVPQKEEQIIIKQFDMNCELISTVRQFCEDPLNSYSKKYIVSLSGGVDSMVLITVLKILNYQVVACHINYNNREETKAEQAFLEYWCNANAIKLYVKTITNIKRTNTKRSDYEYMSKKIRFDFYKEVLEKEETDFILLAHHKDDIIENIFANVCRGRYILDLAVIKEQSIINDVIILRPLIELYKSSIIAFATKYDVPYFKDSTPDWSVRGKFRNKIYPLLEDTFSYNIKSNLIGLSKQAHEWNELVLKQIIEPFLELVIYEKDKCTFNVEKYNNNPLCFWNMIFMKLFYHYDYNCPSRKAILVFMNAIKTKNSGFISLSDNCVCKNNNYEITINFNDK
jgi:tRNA(Ile)-lysidine synthetase-like protein